MSKFKGLCAYTKKLNSLSTEFQELCKEDKNQSQESDDDDKLSEVQWAEESEESRERENYDEDVANEYDYTLNLKRKF